MVYEITRHKVRVADPAAGLIDYSHEEFLRASSPPDSALTESNTGIYLLVEITPVFQERNLPSEAEEEPAHRGLPFFFNYLRPHRRLLFQACRHGCRSFVELIVPFFTQAIVDRGIGNLDLSFIYLLLGAQFMLTLSQTAAEMIRSWLLHTSAHV